VRSTSAPFENRSLGCGFFISGAALSRRRHRETGTGNYALSIRVLDSAGRQASANMPITITTK